MNGKPMNALDYYMMAAQQQQVPPGNPIAEYLQGRASDHASEAAASGLYGAGALTLGAASPYFLPFALPAAGVMGLDAINHMRKQGEMSDGAQMWFDRFGPADPNRRR